MNLFADLAKSLEIIDFHVHPYSLPDENICSYKTDIETQLVRDLTACGISRWCGSCISAKPPKEDYCRDFSLTRTLNDHNLLMADADSRLHPGILVHPDFIDESIAELERAHALGYRLVGELVPYMMGWRDYADPRLDPIFERAGELSMVVSFHQIPEVDMERMVRNHPHTQFVAAHPGERRDYLDVLARMKKYENLSLDLSGTGLFRHGMLEYGVKTVGSERILFGSDYPTCAPGLFVGGVLYANLTDGELENIMSKNAKRLLGLS